MKELKVIVRNIRDEVSTDTMADYEKEYLKLKMKEIKQEKVEPQSVKNETEEDFLFVYEKKPKMPKAKPRREVLRKSVNSTKKRVAYSKHQCKICLQYSSSRKGLKYHIECHYKPASFDCKKCGIKYQQKVYFKNHSCISDRTCSHCGKNFKHMHSLRQHMKSIHNVIDGHLCDYCGVCFKLKEKLKKHIIKCSKGIKKKFSCDQCDKTFDEKTNITFHILSHARYRVECKICHAMLKPSSMRSHMDENHAAIRKEFKCEICSKVFMRRGYWRSHLKTHQEQRFKCPFCNRKFSNQSNLKQHMKFYENPEEFRCQICKRQFKAKYELNHHLKTHDKNRIKHLQCTKCDYKTDKNGCLKNHLLTHDKNREKRFKCQQCSHQNDDRHHFNMHLKMHEKNQINYNNQKRLRCDLCLYSCVKKISIINHMKNTHLI